jgi:hypothetical protein
MLDTAGMAIALAAPNGGFRRMQNDMTTREQRWRPFSLMPAFKFAVGRAAEGASVQAKNMRLAIHQPGLVNRFDLVRMRIVYEEAVLNATMCREQVKRWRVECTTLEQHRALDRLAVTVNQWSDDSEAVIAAIKTLLHEC